MGIAKLIMVGPANTLERFNFFIPQNNSFVLILQKRSVDLWAELYPKCRIGLLDKSLIINREFGGTANYCMEIKYHNTHFLGKHMLTFWNQIRLHLRCFFVSFIYDTLYYVSVPRFQKPSHKVGVDPIKTDWEVVESISLYSPKPTGSRTSRHKHFHYKFTNVSDKR